MQTNLKLENITLMTSETSALSVLDISFTFNKIFSIVSVFKKVVAAKTFAAADIPGVGVACFILFTICDTVRFSFKYFFSIFVDCLCTISFHACSVICEITSGCASTREFKAIQEFVNPNGALKMS